MNSQLLEIHSKSFPNNYYQYLVKNYLQFAMWNVPAIILPALNVIGDNVYNVLHICRLICYAHYCVAYFRLPQTSSVQPA